jgi:hypothetical protein
MVYRLSPRAVPLLWWQVYPHLERALKRVHHRYFITDVEQWLKQGSHHLWVVSAPKGHVVAVLMAEIVIHPSGVRMFDVLLAAGSRVREWLPEVYRQMLEFAHLHGVIQFRVSGRRGWMRHLKPYGFALEGFVLLKQTGMRL